MPRPWTGSWTGTPDNPSVVSAVSAMIRVICAGRTLGAWGRASHNPPVVGSSATVPPRPSQLRALAAGVSRVEAHVLHSDDFLALVLGDGVPDGHRRRAGAVRMRRAAGRRGGRGPRGPGLARPADGRSCAGPSTSAAAAGPRSPARTSPGSGRGDHSRIPHASASSSRVNAGASSPGPGSATSWCAIGEAGGSG